MKTKQITALVGLALLVAASAVLALELPGGAVRHAQGQEPLVVGFDMDPVGNSCPGDGVTDCTLGPTDACVAVPSGGGEITFDVYLDRLPPGGSFVAFSYVTGEKDGRAVGTMTAVTHDAADVNLLTQAPQTLLIDWSDPLPAPLPGWEAGVVDFNFPGSAEYNPPFTKGVLSRLTVDTSGTADGVYRLTLEGIIVADDAGYDYCDPISPTYTGCEVLDGDATRDPSGIIAVGVPCPPFADVKISGQSLISPPAMASVSESVDVTLRTTLHNNGPYGPVDVSVSASALAPEDCTVTPASGEPVSVTLPVSVAVILDETWTLHCTQPSSHVLTFNNSIADVSGNTIDPDETNNSWSTELALDVVAEADVSISAQAMVDPPTQIYAGYDTPVLLRKTLHNNGPGGPIDIDISGGASVPTPPPDCTATPDPFNPTAVSLPVSVSQVVDEVWIIHCDAGSAGPITFTFNNAIAVMDPHVTDPAGYNNSASTDLTVDVMIPTPTPTPPITPTPTPTATPGPSNFDPQFDASLSSYGALEPADVHTEFFIPPPDYNFDAAITLTPLEWYVAADADVPNGALVGSVGTNATLGLINGPCNSALPVTFSMMDATADASATVTFDDQFQDADANTLPDGVDKYPDFLTRMFPALTPRARYFGQASVAGSAVSLNLVLFEPGALGFDPSLGYPSVTVLNNNGDPGAVAAPSPITDFCTPLNTAVTTYAISGDNAGTGSDEWGYLVRGNPGEGTYSHWLYARSLRDADGDGIENGLDTCPFDVNVGSPRAAGSGDQDNDGIDDACDPTPDETKVDEDDDAYVNRGDNCPLIANGAEPDNQNDADADGIGDACDPEPDTPDGVAIERLLESQVTVGETCAPVIPGTYNGTVTIDGLPAPDGTLIQAFVEGVGWGSTMTSGGRYAMDVPQWVQPEPPCFEGGLVSFMAGDASCEPTADWSSGLHDLNLTCGAAGPPVTLRVDQGITIDALGVQAPGFGVYTVDVTYDPAAFTPLSCNADPGDLFDVEVCNTTYAPGTVRATAIRASCGVEGDVPLMDVPLEPQPPVCPWDLDVSVQTLADCEGDPIPYTVDPKWWVGDADRDFDRDAVDALFCLQYVVGLRGGSNECPMPPGEIYLPAADADCDGDVDAVDCLFILQNVVGFRPLLCPSP